MKLASFDSKAIRFHAVGEPDVLKLEKVNLEKVQDHEVLISQKAVGVNFIDTYYRTGLYPTILPSGIGFEASGVVEVVGKNVTHVKVGDRVAYCQGPLGAYAEKRILSADFVVTIPNGVSFEQAASVMLKGLTVYYLFKDIYPLEKGETILFHAAAGGVGLLACQWARHIGAKLIGTVSSPEKAEVAKNYGAWEVIDYSSESVVERVKELTQNQNVPVVFDGVGKSTWEVSLDCLKPRGLMVSFGNASGAVTGVNLGILSQKGSLFLTRPSLGNYMDSPEKLRKASQELFNLVYDGVITVDVDQVFPMSDAHLAHAELLNRKRTGGLILHPGPTSKN